MSAHECRPPRFTVREGRSWTCGVCGAEWVSVFVVDDLHNLRDVEWVRA